MHNRSKNRQRGVLVALAVGLVLAVSLVAAMLLDAQSRKYGLDALICRARTAALSFTAEEIRQLDDVPAENSQHLYRNMRRKLTQLAGPGRGHSRAFLTCLKKGEVLFLAGAGVGKPVEPGQNYPDAPEILMTVFSRGRAKGDQVVKDSWGRWAAAFAPVVHPQTGQVVAVLGIYVEASYWRQQFHYSFILPMVYAVILAVFTALFFGLKWRDRKVRDVLQMTHQRLMLETGARQKAEKELRSWKNRYRKTGRFVPHVLFETDAAGVLSFVRTRGAGRMILPGELAIGGQILDSVIPEQRKRASHCLQKVMHGHRVEEKFTVTTKASREVAVRVSGAPMHSKGQIVGTRWVAVELAFPKERVTPPRRDAISPESLTRLDTLTGLPSRFLFQRQLKEAILRNMELEGFLVLLCLDIDRFKQINDGHGREVGDRVLCETARRLKKVLRSTDTVARPGGDEFMIILEEVKSCDDIRIVVGKIQDCLGAPMEINDVRHALSASIGVSIMPQEGVDAQRLQQSADLAMCKAKKSGRDTYQVFSWAADDYAMSEAIMGERLSQALERNELEILYQPRKDLSSGTLRGLEASFCWQHPVRGNVSSSQIIAWAREGGFLLPLWEWYFSAVCRQIRRWQKELDFSGTIAVNLFSEQVGMPWLKERIDHLRAASGVAPCKIVLQIGEEVIAKELPSVMGTMNGLHLAGYTLAVVDFGRDDSCLKFLADLPVSLIKIEKSVVHDQWSSETSDSCMGLMVSAAHRLGVEVAMAGINTVEEAAAVLKIGCDLVQGPLFGGAQSPIFLHDKLLRSGCSDPEQGFEFRWDSLSA